MRFPTARITVVNDRDSRTHVDKTTNLSGIDEFVCHTFCDRFDVPESCFSCPSAQQPDGLQKIKSFHYNSHSQPLPQTFGLPNLKQYPPITHYIFLHDFPLTRA